MADTATANRISDAIRKRRLRENIEGYLFISPAAIIIFVFGIFPIFFAVFVSLHKWRIRRGRFLGLENYQEIFGAFAVLGLMVLAILGIYLGLKLIVNWSNKAKQGTGRLSLSALGWVSLAAGVVGVILVLPRLWADGDPDMLDSLRVTIWYSIGTVPVQIVFGLLLAVLLDQKFRGKQAFRVIFLLPWIVPTVASATVFERLLSLRSEGFANQVLGLFGAEPLQWLLEVRGVFDLLFGWGVGSESAGVVSSYWTAWAGGPSLALFSIMLFNYWVFVGYYALIYANGLANIPKQLYEAAEVDGAPKRTVFFRIVVPLLSPSTFFLTMLGIIGTFKAFNHLYVLRNAAARGAVDTMSIHIFFTFFRKSRFGYAAAMALVLFVIVIALTVFQRRVMEKRVFYGE